MDHCGRIIALRFVGQFLRFRILLSQALQFLQTHACGGGQGVLVSLGADVSIGLVGHPESGGFRGGHMGTDARVLALD